MLFSCINKDVNKVTIPEYVVGKDGVKCKVTSIGEKAFSDCFILETLTLSQFVKSVGYKALDGCHLLRRIYILGNEISIDAETLHYEGSNITIYMLEDAVECWKTLTQMVPPRRIYRVNKIDEEKDDDVEYSRDSIAIVKL